jgi:hypothetical protein
MKEKNNSGVIYHARTIGAFFLLAFLAYGLGSQYICLWFFAGAVLKRVEYISSCSRWTLGGGFCNLANYPRK